MKSKIEQIKNEPTAPYRLARAQLALDGISLAQWCQERGLKRQWVVAVLSGKRTGPAAVALKSRVLQELGIE